MASWKHDDPLELWIVQTDTNRLPPNTGEAWQQLARIIQPGR